MQAISSVRSAPPTPPESTQMIFDKIQNACELLQQSLETANIDEGWRASSGPRFEDNQFWPTKVKRFL
jgi:hypothetical protein